MKSKKRANPVIFGKKAIDALFSELRAKNELAFIPFLVLGDPDEERSFALLEACVKGGADMIEVGIPYSEPLADGPVIQRADLRALSAGIDVERALGVLRKFKEKHEIPVGLLVYYNLIHARGFDSFYKLAKYSGIDAVLAADAPVEESSELLEMAEKYGLAQVFLAPPTTTEKRLEKILDAVSGYLYIVAVVGVTGAREEVQRQTVRLIEWIKSKTDIPLCVGFGISKPEHVKELAESGADGAIVGSAMIKVLEEHLQAGDEAELVENYVKKMKAATRSRHRTVDSDH